MREKKPDKRKLHGAETKQRLFDIAIRLFSERDYTEVMVEDITDEAGITKGAFYTHFESKDALIAEVIAYCVSNTDTDYRNFVQQLPADMTACEVLLALTDKISDVISEEIGCNNMRKVYQLLLTGSIDTEAMKGFGRELYFLLCEIFAKGAERGEIRGDIPVQMLARHYVAAFRGVTYEWCIHAPDLDLKEQARELFKLMLEGICV